MRKAFAFCVIIFFSMAVLLKAAGPLEKEMAVFDKQYLSALILTGQDNKANAKRVLKSLLADWRIFKKNHLGSFEDDSSTKVDFSAIDQMLSDAESIARLNGSLAEAHEILQGSRIVFYNLRKRNSLDYYLDYLTAFYEPMHKLVSFAGSKNPETLSTGSIVIMRDVVADAIKSWSELQNAAFDPALFSFSKQTEIKRLEYIKAEAEALDQLKQALDNTMDKAEIIRLALAIEPGYNNLLALFADAEKIRQH